jgi:hypothetical protein
MSFKKSSGKILFKLISIFSHSSAYIFQVFGVKIIVSLYQISGISGLVLLSSILSLYQISGLFKISFTFPAGLPHQVIQVIIVAAAMVLVKLLVLFI